ncbi:helix-turn-helix domain-containing protein [Extibacter muris]|uniref:XRE family transcriptional regulator n=1 Tax=Extibacter muris TaxID=1796622 RepID=A0A4R4FGD8_9FIRM|nr:helix-turn-helix domain-containing protein [Extibacter muris]MCU0079360.1 helix-turn-helix transcriptional regulator [Extibacter muris]TDA21919.1 XRE family transcriptional regulator [Extibacter muris]
MKENKIRKSRMEAGLTQQQMSDMLEIPIRTIKDWEAATHNPPKYVEKLIIEKLESIKEGKLNK